MKCPDIKIFDDYFSGLLPSPKRTELEEHLLACPRCKAVFESEKNLDSLLRAEPVQKAPENLHRQVMQQIAAMETGGGLPDWFMALAFGLVVAFVGFMAGKYGQPLLDLITRKTAGFQFELFNLDFANSIAQSELYMRITGGSPIMVLNFLVAGLIAGWGLWQMVKVLRN
jgi:hypothetical protein